LYLFFEVFGYLLLAWYLDLVLPKEQGVNRSPFFPITWLWQQVQQLRQLQKAPQGSETKTLLTKRPSINLNLDDDVEIENGDRDIVNERTRAFSEEEHLVRILELSKKYEKRGRQEDRFALDKLSLVLDEGDCLGLLGPNGAGKTTLISILCGLAKTTSGTALISKFDINSDMHRVHDILGFCPQHDILWPDLSVMEHLLFYCRLKNYDKKYELKHVIQLAERIGLGGMHLDKRVSQLSGGMKRRLSIAISMVGEAKLVLLDEPTTGLDPESRRAVWDIIESHKYGRSFIITTHNMEEADVLCSRIAIMSLGRLKCLGQPLYLKNKFGGGYILTVNVVPGREDDVDEFVQKLCPGKYVLSQVRGTVEYQLPYDQVDVATIFSEMKHHKEEIGILEWSINQTNMEQVFLKLIAEDES